MAAAADDVAAVDDVGDVAADAAAAAGNDADGALVDAAARAVVPPGRPAVLSAVRDTSYRSGRHFAVRPNLRPAGVLARG